MNDPPLIVRSLAWSIFNNLMYNNTSNDRHKTFVNESNEGPKVSTINPRKRKRDFFLGKLLK